MRPQGNFSSPSSPVVQKVANMCLMFVVVTCLVLVDSSSGSDTKQPLTRDRRDAEDQTTPSSGDLTDIIRHLSSTENMLGNFDLMQYTPSTPSPEDVNCYVEVPVTRRVGGRCVSLGSNAMGCQAGVYLALSSQCQGQGQLQGQTSRRGLGRLFNRRNFNRRRSSSQP